MEAIYLKEVKSYSISEIMNFRDKHIELVNSLAQDDLDSKDTRRKRKVARLSTEEKMKKNRLCMLEDMRDLKKSRRHRKELPPVLPLIISEDVAKRTTEAPDLDLVPGKDVVFVFKIYPPFAYGRNSANTKIRPNMEIAILGNQTLNLLCDKILCDDSHMEVGGDISETPDVPVRQRLGEKFKSRMLYIGNNFYIDNSHEKNIDYSESIRVWGERQNILFGETLDMHRTSCLDLVARIGYPYVFQHIGGCEHIIRIAYARLIEEKDCLESKLYPFYTYIARNNNPKICMACMELSQWIIFNSSRMITSPSFLCDVCFRSYHYIDGKKVGQFSAVRYWDCPILGHMFDAVCRNEESDDQFVSREVTTK